MDNKETVTGRQEMILVPRIPTKEMLDRAYYPALAEDAATVWEAMIEEFERQTSLGKSGERKRGTERSPLYTKFRQDDESATPHFGITCDEGWRESIVCTGMYEWAADWLIEQIQGKPFADHREPVVPPVGVEEGE